MAGTIGFKATVEVDDAGTGAAPGGASIVIDGVTVITLPDEETGEAETTELNQGDPYKRFIALLIDAGTLKIEHKATQDNITRVRTLQASRKLYTFKVKAPVSAEFGTTTGQIYSFSGFVKKRYDTKFEREGVVMNSFDVRLSGGWTVTAGTSS